MRELNEINSSIPGTQKGRYTFFLFYGRGKGSKGITARELEKGSSSLFT